MTVNNLGYKIHYTVGEDVASATALPVLSDGDYFDVTGTTTVTSINTLGEGMQIKLHFDGALILTHHATNLVLPGEANITTAAGDEACFVEYELGKWRCVDYSMIADGPGTNISDTVYGAGWNGDTTVGASKNALYDKIETLAAKGSNTDITGLHAMYDAFSNILIGDTDTGLSLTTGAGNIAIGLDALQTNQTGQDNIAIGYRALYTTATSFSTAVGFEALKTSTGLNNVAMGYKSLTLLTEGTHNTAMGYQSLAENLTGDYNTGIGFEALEVTLGDYNTGLGYKALHLNAAGAYNTACGVIALSNNTTGSNNIALGYGAGVMHANGSTPLASADNSIYIGDACRGKDNSDSNSIVIGNAAIGEGANTTVIGNTSTTSTYIKGKRIVLEDAYNNLFLGTAGTGATITTGWQNIAIGTSALNLLQNGYRNYCFGGGALGLNVSGYHNVAMGWNACHKTTVHSNVGIGHRALNDGTTGTENTGVGTDVLYFNQGGHGNVALGKGAGMHHANGSTTLTSPENSIYIGHSVRGKDNSDSNSIVIGHTAIGKGANTTVIGNSSTTDVHLEGDRLIHADADTNVIIGTTTTGAALTNGAKNIAIGNDTLNDNTSGGANTAIGEKSGAHNTTSSQNVCVGYEAGTFHTNGSTALTTAANSTYIGCKTTGKDNNDNNSTVIGYNSTSKGANTVVLGNTSVTQTYLHGIVDVTDGGQIKFPATAIPSADVNTLDDYEEGTFTPNLKFADHQVGMTFDNQVGWYTKIGRTVTINLYILLTSKGTSVGAATIEGLPFALMAGAYAPTGLHLSHVSFADTPQAKIHTNSTVIHLTEETNGGVLTNIDDAQFQDNSTVCISVTYMI